MPRDRWTLTASTKVEYAKLAKRMSAAGADLAPPEPDGVDSDLRGSSDRG